MDPITLVGLVAAFALVFTASILEGGNPMSMFLLPPMMLVLGGSIAAAAAGGVLSDTLAVPKVLVRAFMGKISSTAASVDTLVKLAEKARREGLLALEDAARDIEDPFLKDGLQLAIDGTDPEELADVLLARVDAKRAAEKQEAKFFMDMGAYAPTIGIVGTVLGLVHVLENLDKPDQLGHMIAVAFLATLWGVMSANLIFLPLGNRLKRLTEIECNGMELVVEGILAIQSGANPRIVARRLSSLLPPGTKQAEDAA